MAAVILSACGLVGTPPSDDEIKGLISKQLSEINKSTAWLGSNFIVHLENVTNYGCEPHENMNGAFTCDLEVTMKTVAKGAVTVRDMASYGKTKDGVWYEIRK